MTDDSDLVQVAVVVPLDSSDRSPISVAMMRAKIVSNSCEDEIFSATLNTDFLKH